MFQDFPRISRDFAAGKENLTNLIDGSIKIISEKYDVKPGGDSPSVLFKDLIYQLHKKYQQRVVIIIDEYDKPLLSTIDQKELNDEYRAFLKGFYGVLKSADEYLKFVFLTGVTKFSQVSVFSDLNHLTDISLNSVFSCICGFTQEEVEKYFEEKIDLYADENRLELHIRLSGTSEDRSHPVADLFSE